ncbi:hypothetical protein EYB45_10955 [Erythrobacteraceae bacterium CFH 75059]|nr:hypothetical protein EYB45_10955 [Erythrobacteraceae bacterium CFH 75059]
MATIVTVNSELRETRMENSGTIGIQSRKLHISLFMKLWKSAIVVGIIIVAYILGYDNGLNTLVDQRDQDIHEHAFYGEAQGVITGDEEGAISDNSRDEEALVSDETSLCLSYGYECSNIPDRLYSVYGNSVRENLKAAGQSHLAQDANYNDEYAFDGEHRNLRFIPSPAPSTAINAIPITTNSYGRCAENGSCYGDISEITGNPKTIEVQGYYRSDGTYVRGHFRSK